MNRRKFIPAGNTHNLGRT